MPVSTDRGPRPDGRDRAGGPAAPAGTGDEGPAGPAASPLGWRSRPVMGAALLMVAAGFTQFSPTAALADVAEHFGALRDGNTLAEQAGLPGSVLGAGLAVIRLSALAAFPLAAVADRVGRRRTALAWCACGLLAAASAALSPGYWWFVVAFALARPFLTATDTLSELMAAEHTGAGDRAKAIALVSAAYGVGAGLVAVLRGVAGEALGFRAVFGLAGVLLALVALAARLVAEPGVVAAHSRPRDNADGRAGPAMRRVPRALRGRLAVLALVAFASGFVTGPVGTFLFVYAENVLDVSRTVTGALVVAAGLAGLAGLVVGQALADRLGRRPAAGGALVLMAAAGVLTYSGSVPALAAGYLTGVLCGAAYGTPALALTAELFPTSVRAGVAGRLVVAGVLGATSGLWLAGSVADAFGSFSGAMVVVCVPGGLAAALFGLLPETRGHELDDAVPGRRGVGEPA
jgi:MFS family permease